MALRGKAGTTPENTKHDKAYIRHYLTKTKEEWLRRRMRMRDCSPVAFFVDESEALTHFNNYEKQLNAIDYQDFLSEVKKLSSNS